MVRTPEHRFIRYLMDKFHKLPDDPFYENINAYLKVWLYESWLYEEEREIKKMKDQAILIGSFSNLEMAQKMVQDETPTFKTTDFDETSKNVHESILESTKQKNRKRKTRKIVSNSR